MKSMQISFMLLFFAVLFSCKKKDPLPKLPVVMTTAITDIAPSSAKGGGNITSDGGRLVLASGLCYSTTSQMPTVSDDTTRTAALTGTFTSTLKDLLSSSTYYVRAYATNEFGTGYGEVRSFTTGNEAPVASNIIITGEIKGDIELTVAYTYTDKESDEESGTTIQWYRADNAAGQNTVAIPNATTNKYRVAALDENKILWVGITPKSTTGTPVGAEATSEKKGPVGVATTVTFTYNGAEVTYGIINSSVTGRRWLDRNLGAPGAPTSISNYVNLGDLFQWGRLADGHQLMVRTPNSSNPARGTTTSVNPFVTSLSDGDNPGNNNFIMAADAPYDWRKTINNNLWQGVNSINNPCPEGWHVPTLDEWTAEQLGNGLDEHSRQLNLTNTGYRDGTSGDFSGSNNSSFYWTSTIDGTSAIVFSRILDGAPSFPTFTRGCALSCRCVQDVN